MGMQGKINIYSDKDDNKNNNLYKELIGPLNM
jgi:hypothetical protein